ncbi:oxidoreductase [Haloferula helveola]|uniref:Oxidoreductase n=1 Tax=Haloferula helveola TaxID=490095 RepID=A0ABN6H5E9_9BACT|nr:oxidoreductase [Haloferula helveola]
MSSHFSSSRRQFLTGAAATAIFGPSILRAAEANSRLNVAFIGYGKRAYGVMGQALRQADLQIVAVCDVEGTRRAKAKEVVEKKYAEDTKSGKYSGCTAYVDYRELLEKEDLDAVVIMTPDHMHVHPALAAVEKGLDIYCEKPLTQNIAEGRLLADAVKRNKIIFQTGSQQRSEFGNRFRTAVEMIWAGRIGKIKTIRIGVGESPKPCDLPAEEKPDNVDWDLWLGPAPMRPYNEILCPKGLHNHFPAFRHYEEYAGGKLADMGAHHFDIAQWALGMDGSGPVRVEPPAEGDSGLKFIYENGVEMFHGGKSDCTFEGTEGTIWVGRGELKSDSPDILKQPLADGDRRVQPSNNHLRNWIDAVKSRKDPICTVETGHRTATVCHLANIGYKLRRPLKWDPVKERFADDDEANALTTRKARKGWEYA